MAFVPYHDDRGFITFGGEPYQRAAATAAAAAATLPTGTPLPSSPQGTLSRSRQFSSEIPRLFQGFSHFLAHDERRGKLTGTNFNLKLKKTM